MSHKKILEALARGPVKSTIGRKTIALERRKKTYHIIVTEPGKKPQVWQYEGEVAIERYEKLVDLFRRNA